MPNAAAPSPLERVGSWHETVAAYIQPALTLASGLLLTQASASFVFFIVGGSLAILLMVSQVSSNLWAKRVARLAEQNYKRQLEAAEDAAREDYLSQAKRFGLLATTLEPIQRAAAAMVIQNKAERDATFQVLVKELLEALRFVYSGVEGLRAVVYTFDDARRNMNVVGQVSHGRRDAAGPFLEGTKRGKLAMDRVRSNKPLFVADIADAPNDWAGSGKGYNTFIAYPVTSSAAAYGMVTLDAVYTDDITEENVDEVGLVAGIAAVVFACWRREESPAKRQPSVVD
ncbi:GAF domain-containing protein [Leifsonia poae]|uniref:GAF domain-containing protein n=1 Tax=Leifsonia poae TaxID=110933 RepID=UPI003D666053